MSTPAPWYAPGLHFTCTRCGNCCSGAPGHVWVCDEEIAALAAYFGLSPEHFRRLHTRPAGQRAALLELPGGDCEFLERLPDGRTRCRIHPLRPLQCRTWPFWESNLRSPRAWERTGASCPGINRGQYRPLPVIEQMVRANAAACLPL